MMGKIIIWSSFLFLPLVADGQWSQPGDRWAFHFGGDTKIELANESLFDFTESVTLEFDVWFDNVTTGTFQGVIAKRDSTGATTFGINFNPATNIFQWYINDGGGYKIHRLTLRTYFSAGQWYHIQCSFQENGSNVDSEIIIDGGTPITSTFTGTSVAGNSAVVTFGVSQDTSEYFDGKLDNVRISGDGKTVSYHRFDNGDGASSTDRLGNADGTITVGSGGWHDKWTPPFSPLNYDNLVVWLEANDVDGDGNPGNNSGDYSTWTDLSGNGNDFTTYSGAGSPTYTTGGLNGNAYMDFIPGGNYDMMESGSISALSTADEYTMFIVADLDVVSGRTLMINFGTGPITTLIWQVLTSSTQYRWRVDAANAQYSNVTGTVSDPHVGIYIWDSSDEAFCEINGSVGNLITNRNATITAHTNIYFGANGPGDIYTPWDGRVYEVLIYSTTLSSGDITAIENYLTTKYGL